MAWSKAKVTAVTTVALLLTAGTATVATTTVRHYREEAMWHDIALVMTDKKDRSSWKLPRAFSFRRSKLEKRFNDEFEQWDANAKILGLAVPAAGVWGHAFKISRDRILNPELLPSGRFDFISSDSARPQKALQSALSRQFGIVAQKELIETNVLILSVARPNAPGLKPSAESRFHFIVRPGEWDFGKASVSSLALELEHCFKMPVVDQSGLTDLYDMDLVWGEGGWRPDPEKLKQVLFEQFGLQLKPDTQTVEMLVLKKTR